MTSNERREARYQRRQQARQKRREERAEALGPLDRVYSFRKLFLCGKKCCRGVRNKQSTQNFEWHLFSGTASRRRRVLDGSWKPGKTNHFTLRERGKVRPIDAPHISDRQVEKALTEEVLTPLYAPEMIYRNGASQKGKGLHWHYEELKKSLRAWYREHGRNGVVIQSDFHNFFPSADHTGIYEHHRKLIIREDLRQAADAVVRAAPGGVGMFLGVQPSQQEMVTLPSGLDNWLTCQKRVAGAGHYMDDYVGLAQTAGDGREILKEMTEKAAGYHFQMNENKCKVTLLTKPFRFCKVKFLLTETGRIITHGCRDGMKRARRKINHIEKCVREGKLTVETAWLSIQGHVAYYRKHNDHGRVLRLMRLFYATLMKGRGLTWNDILHTGGAGKKHSAGG